MYKLFAPNVTRNLEPDGGYMADYFTNQTI